MIKPTVGRVVWFHPLSEIQKISEENQPYAAIIAFVIDDYHVNLAVFDQFGQTFSKQDVLLIQDDVAPVQDRSYCEWMPYQIGQAAKTAELEKKLSTTKTEC